jgi:hypothetical protein
MKVVGCEVNSGSAGFSDWYGRFFSVDLAKLFTIIAFICNSVICYWKLQNKFRSNFAAVKPRHSTPVAAAEFAEGAARRGDNKSNAACMPAEPDVALKNLASPPEWDKRDKCYFASCPINFSAKSLLLKDILAV